MEFIRIAIILFAVGLPMHMIARAWGDPGFYKMNKADYIGIFGLLVWFIALAYLIVGIIGVIL